MIMQHEYLSDLKEWIESTPDSVFAPKSLSKKEILADSLAMDRLWAIYQKNIEDYGCDAGYAYSDALHEIFQIDYMPQME